MNRQDLTFSSGRDRCAAWLYPAAGGAPGAPVIVMAHGFTGTRRDRLGPFAERFAAAGVAAMPFDYRGFGDSTGAQDIVDIDRQLEDWRAAIAFARSLPGIDPSRVAVFGSSMGGGHALADKTDTFGFFAVDKLAGQQVILRFRHAAEQRPHNRSVIARSPSHFGMPVAQTGTLGHDADIGKQTDNNACTHSDAVDRCDDRLRAVQHVVDDVARLFQDLHDFFVMAVRVPDSVEIAARGKRTARTGQHNDARFRILIDHGPKIGKSLMHAGIRGVQLLGLAQRNPENARIAAFKNHVRETGIIH